MLLKFEQGPEERKNDSLLFGEKSKQGEQGKEEQRRCFRANNKQTSSQYDQGAQQVGTTDNRCLEKKK